MHTIFVIISIPVWLLGICLVLAALNGRIKINGHAVPNDHPGALVAFTFGISLILVALELNFLEPLLAVIAIIVTHFTMAKIVRKLVKRIKA